MDPAEEQPEPVADAARRRREGIVALLVVQVLFGLFPLFVKLATAGPGGFAPRVLVVWRIAVGSLVLLAVACARHGRAVLPRRADVPRLLLCALLGIALNQVLATEGVARTQVVNAGLLLTLIPVFTYGLALLARQERFRPERAFGIGLALSGAIALTLARRGPPELRAQELVGGLLIVGNCLAYAAFLVLARPLSRRTPPLVLIAWVFALSLWCVPLLLRGQTLVPAAASATAWWGLALTLLFPTILGYLLNTYALARVSASTTAVFIYLQPLVSLTSGLVVLGERPGLAALPAALLLFAGIALVTRERGARVRPAPQGG